MLSVVDSVKLAFNKATISTVDHSLSFDYQYVLSDTSDFDSTPGGKLDVAFETNGANENEYLFICTSQTYSDTPYIPYVLIYEIEIMDNEYLNSVRYVYETWAKCVATT